MAMALPSSPAAPSRARRHSVALAAVLALAGCQTGGVSPWARWMMARDQSMAKAPTREEAWRDQGSLMSRWLGDRTRPRLNLDGTKASVKGRDGKSVPTELPNPQA